MAAKMRVPRRDQMRMRTESVGGFRRAYNVQFATTTEGGVVVGVGVTQEGCDNNQLVPMIERIEGAFGTKPNRMLVDGGYVDREQIEAAKSKHGVEVHAPVKEEEQYEKEGKDPFARRPHDTDGTARWRERMGTEEGKHAYRWRARTAEWVHARARNRGLQQFLVRGLRKVLSTSLIYTLPHNLTQTLQLRKAAAA